MAKGKKKGKKQGKMSIAKFPAPYPQKPVQRITLGFLNNQNANAGSQTYAVGFDDIMYAIAVATGTNTSVPCSFVPLWTAVRIRKIELWELGGRSISLTWSQATATGPWVNGPDATKADSGSLTSPSYVTLKPRASDMAGKWFSTASTGNLFVMGLSTAPSAGSGTTAVRMFLRVHIDYVLNDAFAFPTTITTAGSNTTLAGNIYWRIMNLGSGTVLFFPEAGTQVSTYVS